MYYHNVRMGKSSWDHPMDEQFRSMLKAETSTGRNKPSDTGRLQVIKSIMSSSP